MALQKVDYVNQVTVITAENMNDIQDAIIALETAPSQGLSEEVKQALLQLAQKVAYIDNQGQTYYDDLYNAFYPPKTVVSITAVFEQGSTVIYDDTALNDLKQYLIVTAKYDDNTTAIIAPTAYTLSGLLEAPSSTVTVLYSGVSTTFSVAVTARPTLSSITAVYTQSGTVYDTDSLDSLKADLVVTAVYSDSSTEPVPAADYTLSGELEVGQNTITVSYGGKTTTFSVTVTAGVPEDYTVYDWVKYINTSGSARTKAQWLQLKKYADLNAMSTEFKVEPLEYTGTQPAFMGIRSTSGSSSSFAFYNSTTGTLAYHVHGVDSNEHPQMNLGVPNTIKVTNAAESPSTVQVNDNAIVTVPWANSNVLNLGLVLFGNPIGDANANLNTSVGIGNIKFFDLNNNLVGNYFPVVRKSDNCIGMYDVVEQIFYTSSTASYSTIGNSNCLYTVGNWS